MGIFDRFYYGKAGKADYTEEDLPSNRFQLFWQVLRVRFWSLTRLNLMQMLFWLPLLLITVITLFASLPMAEVDEVTGEIAIVESMEEDGLEKQQSDIEALLFSYLVLLIPCILITGPSSAAAAHVARNWSRDQHSFVWSDFKEAFKSNWKQGLCASAISSVLPITLYVGYRFYGSASLDTPIAVAGQVLVITVGVIWMLALTFYYPLMVGYEMRLGRLIRNSVLLTIGRLPFVIALRLVNLAPLAIGVALLLTSSMYGLLLIIVYYMIIGFALNRLVCASFANGVFDKYINPRIDGAPVNMGLRENDDDDEGDGAS